MFRFIAAPDHPPGKQTPQSPNSQAGAIARKCWKRLEVPIMNQITAEYEP
jgi:hypothetical protein